MRNELYCGDCLDIMPTLESNSIDFILCDLPYGTTKCAWDEIIPFDTLWSQYKRLLKPNGKVILFGSQPFTTKMIASNMDWFREELVWLKNKGGSGMRANSRHLKVHENIIVFSPISGYTYNPQKWRVPDKQFLTQRKTMTFYGDGNNIYDGFKKQRVPDDGMRNPISVVAYAVPVTTAKSKTYSPDVDVRLHPTQKPLDLIEYLITTYSNEGDLVMDNCMGSGTTGLACKKLKRNFIGIELDFDYFNIAKDRIESYE